MLTVSLRHAAVALSGAVLTIGLAGPVMAQTSNQSNQVSTQSSKADLAECNRLYGLWSRYNGTSAYGKMATADVDLEECRKGNVEAGIADLKRVLQRANIPVPPSETATAPR
jgi:hypothetical protein